MQDLVWNLNEAICCFKYGEHKVIWNGLFKQV